MYYVGIDWADTKYDLCILDHDGQVVIKHLIIAKTRLGFEQLLDKLRTLAADPNQFKIGLETPNNLLVDFLVDLGYAVFALFPGSMDSFRKRYRTSGARDDVFDAFVIADVLRTDKACWRPVDFGSEPIREIRVLARDHHGLLAESVAASNSLRSTLKEYYPEYIQFFSNVACATALAFLEAYPTFDAAGKLTRQQVAQFFKEQHWRNGKAVNKIYTLLHQPHLQVPLVLIAAKQRKARACAKQLIALTADIAEYVKRLTELVEHHPDGKIFLSYPGVSYVTAARLLALFGDNRSLYTDVRELQGLTGTCPVTEKTGEDFKIIYYRQACNKFYRDVMRNLAFSSLCAAPWAKAYYQKHRAMGKTHSHVLRCLANLHLRLLFAMWKNKTYYDENLFLAQRARHLIGNRQV
jgi:transposase